MTQALTRYDAARTALLAAHQVDEVKLIRDQAAQLAAAARVANDNDLIAWATEIKVRAERRLGQVLDETEKNKGAATTRCPSGTALPTLAELGISKKLSSRSQQLADLDEAVFEQRIETAKLALGEVTSAFILQKPRKAKVPPTIKRGVPEIPKLPSGKHPSDPDCMTLWGLAEEFLREKLDLRDPAELYDGMYVFMRNDILQMIDWLKQFDEVAHDQRRARNNGPATRRSAEPAGDKP